MLRPEQAKSQLAEWELPTEQYRISDQVAKLPKKLREPTERAFGLSQEGIFGYKGGWIEVLGGVKEAIVTIDDLQERERAKIFQTIGPGLVPVLECTWQLLKTAPFSIGSTRKGFRAPNHQGAIVESAAVLLSKLVVLGQRYPANLLTPTWLATWAPYLCLDYQTFEHEIGQILAGVLTQRDKEADEVFTILLESLHGEHDIGAPGRHVYTAFTMSDREEGWEALEKTLLAAQRQEGIRQAILESIDFGHPVAFRRMLRLILEHRLYRFSSVVRAVDTWFGCLWAAASGGVIKQMLSQVVTFLENPTALDEALKGDDAQSVFLALWCAATEDAPASIPLAEKLLDCKSVEIRYVAVRHLHNLNLVLCDSAMMKAIEDEDLRVALWAIPNGHFTAEYTAPFKVENDDRFERLERLVDRIPQRTHRLKPLVWPWTDLTIQQKDVASCLLFTLGDRPPTRLIPHLKKMEPEARAHAVCKFTKLKKWDETVSEAVIQLAGDASPTVRTEALAALAERRLTERQITSLEQCLTRKSSDLRQGILELLLKQNDQATLKSGSRLLESKNLQQRLAGLEILRLMVEQNRSTEACREHARNYQDKRTRITKQEQTHLDAIASEQVGTATLDDALGLMNPSERAAVKAPCNRKARFITPASLACLKSLDDLVHKHRETSVEVNDYSGTKEELLGTVRWGFSRPDIRKSPEGQAKALPLADLWTDWFHNRGRALRDKDNHELVRAYIWVDNGSSWCFEQSKEWAESSPARKKVARHLMNDLKPVTLKYPHLVDSIVNWLLFLFPQDANDYLLDALETAYSMLPNEDLAELSSPAKPLSPGYYHHADFKRDPRNARPLEMWRSAVENISRITRCEPNIDQQVRKWKLLRWWDEPVPGARRRRPPIDLLRLAYSNDAATLADVADHLLGPRGDGPYGIETFELLRELSQRTPEKDATKWLNSHPEVQKLIEQGVEKILELELGRGDAPTAATGAIFDLSAVEGIHVLRQIFHFLGNENFKLSNAWRHSGNEEKRQTLTHLAKVSLPAPDETVEDFVACMKGAIREGQFPEERLLELSFLAPQWVKHVEAYFGWDQMSEGVYWFLAHMRYFGGLSELAEQELAASQTDDSSPGDTQGNEEGGGDRTQSAWERLIAERTPLTHAERQEGAIDVRWFQRTYEKLKEKRWQQLAKAARFAATPAQAKRAAFIGDVLLNRVSRRELVDGIKKKQLKEHVRLLGLLPLAKGKKSESDLVERLRVLRDYRRYANQLSGLTKPDALRAWEIGMRNLAQTAGYSDPLRLEWAIGAQEVSDLAKGPIVASKGSVRVTLELDSLAQPQVTIAKGERTLKSIPSAIKKDKAIVAITDRVKELKRQSSSTRQSLERALCRGDSFSGNELRQWCEHALLYPLLTRLVVVGEGIIGYPDKGGKALRDHTGKLEPVKSKETLRLAHPHDLMSTGEWDKWQRECFLAERLQPLKQVFRELYVITKQEQQDGTVSRRYDGQQIQPKKALALFGQRGWNTREGIYKVFHDCELTAIVGFDCGYSTPLEVEDATISEVSFYMRDQTEPTPLKSVPPVLFSEVMRDIDLVVSVAHSGGVDPEASASTVEMRTSLLRETCSLLSLDNVRFKVNHALVDGELANYSVHLGSGTVHKMPGGSLCVVPVHSQHRGRLFLPFADDDPRTAEIISKVLLLARDNEIKDPTILEQIRH